MKYYLFIIFIILYFTPLFFVSAWSSPIANPPNNNAPAPLDVSSINQFKRGSFSIGGLQMFPEITLNILGKFSSDGLYSFLKSLTIVDGTQGANKILVSKDDLGQTLWTNTLNIEDVCLIDNPTNCLSNYIIRPNIGQITGQGTLIDKTKVISFCATGCWGTGVPSFCVTECNDETFYLPTCGTLTGSAYCTNDSEGYNSDLGCSGNNKLVINYNSYASNYNGSYPTGGAGWRCEYCGDQCNK